MSNQTQKHTNSENSTLQRLAMRVSLDHEHFIGFPGVAAPEYAGLADYFPKLINNVGDPFIGEINGTNTKELEREVISFCANLFRAPANDRWGYVTNGGTEANLYALYVARHKYPNAKVYYSTAAHYSIPKNIHILGMRSAAVPAHPDGEMDYVKLGRALQRSKGKPAIVVATVGTTMTEAKDDVAAIKRTLEQEGTTDYFIHADAALAGIYAALLRPRHKFDFVDGADSVSISGHKFLGVPMPCGVIVLRESDRRLIKSTGNYTGSADTTISGSRNGHTALMLWYAIQRLGLPGLLKRAQECQAMAAYAHERLKTISWESWRNPNALTIMISEPPRAIIRKWQLATADGWSHIICMPGVRKAKINAFVDELAGLKM